MADFGDLLGEALQQGKDTAAALAEAKSAIQGEYKDYVEALDKKEAVALLEFYRKNAKPENYLSGFETDFASLDIPAYVEKLFAGSKFTSLEKVETINTIEEIKSDPAAKKTIFILQNNGIPPAGEIRETGGLLSLRALVEHSGGEMSIRPDPAFRLVIRLGK